MATTAETVKASIETAIKAITPTKLSSRRFRLRSDDNAAEADDGAASSVECAFEVWHGGGQAPSEETFDGFHDPSEEEVREEFKVHIAYPFEADFRRLDNRIRADVANIKHAVNDPAAWATDVLKQRVIAWSAPMPDKQLGAFFQTLTVYVRFLETE